MEKKHFGSWPFYRSALLIALPVMGQSLIENLVSLIDNFMVSGLGDVKMSGVNIAAQILFVFMVLMMVTCTAGGIFLTQFFGAHDRRGMRQSVCYKIISAGTVCVFYMIVCMLFPRRILSLMVIGNSQAEEILEEGVKYMFLMGFVGIPMTVSNIIASSLREIGRVRPPVVISASATLVNTVLNWGLIYGRLGMPRLEVRGAAIATVIARCFEMILYIGFAAKVPQPFNVHADDLKHVDWKLFRDILRKGSLVILSEMMWVISETITTALYNSRGGADVVSGMSAGFAVANLYFVAFGGITTATSIVIGRSLGAGRIEEARTEGRWMLNGSAVFGLITALFGIATMFLVPVFFANLSTASQMICRSMVFWMALLMPVWVYQNAQLAISRAGGDTRMGIVVEGTCTFGIVFPMMFTLAWKTSVGPVAIYILTKTIDILKVVWQYFWLKKERWVRNLAKEHETAEIR